jgi:hypothetical protein
MIQCIATPGALLDTSGGHHYARYAQQLGDYISPYNSRDAFAPQPNRGKYVWPNVGPNQSIAEALVSMSDSTIWEFCDESWIMPQIWSAGSAKDGPNPGWSAHRC